MIKLLNVKRIIESIGMMNDRSEVTGSMGKQSIAEVVEAHVSHFVRIFGRAQQAESHEVTEHSIAILAVVEQCHTAVVFAEVSPEMAHHFELGSVPRGVAMGGARDPAKRHVIARLIGLHVEWEQHLEELAVLVPLHFSFKFHQR